MDFYFHNGVFVTSVKDFEPYLSSSFAEGAIRTDLDLLRSPAFKEIFDAFLREFRLSDKDTYSYFAASFDHVEDDLMALGLALYGQKRDGVCADKRFSKALADGGLNYYRVMRAFFAYWLSLARFATLDDGGRSALGALKPRMLFLRKSVFHIYNVIRGNLFMKEITLETDYSAGFLAGFTTRLMSIPYPEEYQGLNAIPFVSAADLNLPYCAVTKRNKRIGVYQSAASNPLAGVDLSGGDWLCLPFKCGSSLVYFYFTYKYANTVLGTLNLFEKAEISECNKKPDICIVFGGDKGSTTGVYYEDRKNDLLVGYVSDTDEADYFGYVKKLILTLHNIRMIEKGALPIHGSMVKVTIKGGKSKNIVIMGDSGAGKSESIEALRQLASEYLESITIVFDDMGTLFLKDGTVYASGTEIGAFVRIDDLDVGYAFSHLNDALMYNLGGNNARLVYTCTPYEEVVRRYPIDMFLYANNYDDEKTTLKLFDNYMDMVAVCEEGERKAKGTTGEVGLVKSYFANPFGPVQMKDETHKLVVSFFKALSEKGSDLGLIYTKLAISGHEKSGPEEAAKSLLEWIKKH